MKICIISSNSPLVSTGGIERYLDTISKEIVKRGHEIHLVVPAFLKEEVEIRGNLHIHKIKALNVKIKNKILGAKKFYNYLRKLIKREKIDIISAENFYRSVPPSYTFAVNLASMETNTPVILRMHTHFTNELQKSLTKDLFWNKIIPVSKSITESTYEIGVNVDRLVTINPPIDTEIFRPKLGKEWLRSRIDVSKKDLIILQASRIVSKEEDDKSLEAKGIITLLKAFSIISPHFKNAKLLIASATPPPTLRKKFEAAKNKIYELAELNGIKDKVIIQPFSLEEMPHVYNGSDIFVMASQMESFGLVYAEALACGVPVVGTSVGGIPEIIDNGKTGYLIEPDLPVELSKRIDWMLQNEKKRSLMGLRGRKEIERRFSVRKITDNLIGVFNSVIEGKRSTSRAARVAKKNGKAEKKEKKDIRVKEKQENISRF